MGVKRGFRSLEDAIDKMLVYLGLSEQEGALDRWLDEFRLEGDIKIPLRHWDGAEPMVESFITERNKSGPLKSHQREFLPVVNMETGHINEDECRELAQVQLGEWTCSVLLPPPDGMDAEVFEREFKKKNAVCLYMLRKQRRVPMRELRGWKLASGDVQEDAIAFVFNDGTYRAQRYIYERRGIYFYMIGCPWEITNPVRVTEESFHECTSATPGNLWIARSWALTQQYEWAVKMGWQNNLVMPRISFPCDPTGNAETFKKRDIPTGKNRREALRNWVREHWRTSAAVDKPETHIWPHLRGATKFVFSGLECEIVPSQYDLKKAVEYQAMMAKNRIVK